MIKNKALWEIVKITKWKKVDFSDKWEKWYIDIWILRTNQIVQYTDDNWVECNDNDILIAWDWSKSWTIWYWLNWIIWSTLAKLEITEKDIYTPYVWEFLKSKFDYLNTYTSWAAIPHIRKEVLVWIEIPLPPLKTQKAIVAKLDQIFAELDQTKSEIQKNLDNADELWKSALNQAFQGDWEVKKLGEVCDFVRWPFGWSLKKEIFVKEWYAVYEQQHAIYNQFSDFRYFINDEKFLEMKRFEVYPWDLIMSCSWTMGKVSIVPKNSPKWIINQALLKITPSKLINAEFLKNWMDSKDFQDQIWANTQWAAIQNVASVKVISTLNIPVPPLSEQEKIVEHLDQVSKEVKALKSQYQSQLDNLEELKKSVLDKAFRWELGE